MVASPQRDSLAVERGVRFGCGACLGTILGFLGAMQALDASFSALVVGAALGALLCGFLAVRFGDRFWESLPDWLQWW